VNRHSLSYLFKLSAYWFAVNFLWGAMLAIVLPSQIQFLVGDNTKSAFLGTLLSVGALVAMLCRPLFGALSDRSSFRAGRRRPFMVAGALLSMIPLYIMGSTRSIFLYSLGFLLLQLFINISAAGYQGLIPDTVAQEQMGVASSFMGAMTILGSISAVIVSGRLADNHSYHAIYLITGIVILVFMTVTAIGIREKQYTNREAFSSKIYLKAFYVNPRTNPNFVWILVCSFLIMLGSNSAFNFQQYYFEDVLRSAHPAQDISLISTVVLVCAAVISVMAGALSDKIGRKEIFALSAWFMSSMAVVLLFQPPLILIVATAVIFGLGYGGFTSVQWALITEFLPGSNSSSKDLGLWTVSTTLPQVIGPKIGGYLISAFRGPHIAFGYTILYAFVAVDLIAGGLLILRIKNRAVKG